MNELKRILYAEDEPDIMAVVKIALEDIGGFELETASSGAEALSKARQFLPDLILLDVMMPGMDGPSTLAHLRDIEALREVPVVFMTAKVQPGEIENFKKLGVAGIIAKPFDPMTLADTVRAIWSTCHAGA